MSREEPTLSVISSSLRSVLTMRSGSVAGRARVDLAEVVVLDGIRLVEEKDVPVGSPDGLLQVGLGPLRGSRSGPAYCESSSWLDGVVVGVDVLPREDVAGCGATAVPESGTAKRSPDL